ncbi:hypothetical protein, partial [Aminobacter sp. J44]|uniref:hypothetical protein n=1 Tax=Aminobacter sp. J44 TaxID=935262 RepID=UPI001AEDBEC0
PASSSSTLTNPAKPDSTATNAVSYTTRWDTIFLNSESDFRNFESRVGNIESKYRKFFRFEINRCKLKHIICVRCDVTVQTRKIPAASGKSRRAGISGSAADNLF